MLKLSRLFQRQKIRQYGERTDPTLVYSAQSEKSDDFLSFLREGQRKVIEGMERRRAEQEKVFDREFRQPIIAREKIMYDIGVAAFVTEEQIVRGRAIQFRKRIYVAVRRESDVTVRSIVPETGYRPHLEIECLGRRSITFSNSNGTFTLRI